MGRSLRRWMAFLVSRGCGSSTRRLGNSWCLRASGNWWNAAYVRDSSQPASGPVQPTFSCDQCDAVCGKLRALRSHQIRAHQRRRKVRCPVCKADFRSRPRVIQHLEVEARRCAPAWKHGGLDTYSDDAVAPLTSWTACTGGVASGKGAIIWQDRP